MNRLLRRYTPGQNLLFQARQPVLNGGMPEELFSERILQLLVKSSKCLLMPALLQ